MMDLPYPKETNFLTPYVKDKNISIGVGVSTDATISSTAFEKTFDTEIISLNKTNIVNKVFQTHEKDFQSLSVSGQIGIGVEGIFSASASANYNKNFQGK